MKKVLSFVTMMSLALLVVFPVYAKPADKPIAPAEKTTGSVGYDAYGLYRYAEFNAHELSENCSVSDWNFDGNWVLGFNSTKWPSGNPYQHDMTVSGSTAIGGAPAGGPYVHTWNATLDFTSGISIDANYITGPLATSYHYYATGTVAPGGTVSGNWTDTLNDSGTWYTISGAATKTISGCEGKGEFHYSDVNGDWYNADVKYVKVEGEDAWFGAHVTGASNASWIGNWVFVKTHDGGEPASGVDQVWGSFVSESAAKMGVATMVDPSDGPFTVTEGNLQVHTY